VRTPAVSRGFLAVVPPADVLDAVEHTMAGLDLPATARRARRSQLHLTVRFLGNHVDFVEIEAMMHDLKLSGGRVQLGGAGAFPRARRGDVVWIGLREGEQLLRDLHATVDAAYNPHGPANEPAPRFHAHLTVARCKSSTDLRTVVDAIGTDPVGRPWIAEEMVLIRSHLGRGPAEYEEKARFRLEL
jgi:2'-5' RNA ligase